MHESMLSPRGGRPGDNWGFDSNGRLMGTFDDIYERQGTFT